MIVALGLLLNVVTTTLGCIFSMLFSDFRARHSISIPTPPITEFFSMQIQRKTSIHCLYWDILYLSLWSNLYSCMHILSMLWSNAEALSSGSWPILFDVLTLNVAICIELLHFSNFSFSLNSVTNFSNTRARAPNSAGPAPFFYPREELRGLDMRFDKLSW